MNWSNLRADVDFLCGSTSATYTDANKMRNMTVAYHDVARQIWESDGAWRFDDANNTDSPIAYRTVANASATYLIPTTALRVEQVEIKDGNANWQKLRPITDHDITISPEEFLGGGTGTPLYYQLVGTQITLFPAPGTGYVTMASGMAVRLNRNVSEPAVTATTTEPGFAGAFHRILSYAAALDFVQDPRQREYLIMQKTRLEKGLSRFYQGRWVEQPSRIKPAMKKRWRLYT